MAKSQSQWQGHEIKREQVYRLSTLRFILEGDKVPKRLPPLPQGTLMVMFDISSLYANIPHEEGIKTCEEFLNLRELLVPSSADICHLVWLILTMNCFLFNESHFIQVHGTAMGICTAPSYANLYYGEAGTQSSC